jgi:hypothetical protein
LFGQEHVDRYRATDGEQGHDWQGTTVLLLTTTGRNSGAKRTTPRSTNATETTTSWWPPTAAAIHPAGSSTFKTIRSRPYDEFQAKPDPEIPVVVLEPG